MRKKRFREVDLSLPAQRVIRDLAKLFAWRGFPLQLLMGNDPAFTFLTMAEWVKIHGTHL